MLARDGHLYLIDFGIARHFKPGQTKDTIAFGSPDYAASKQYGSAQTTPRSDIDSLGAILHQMVTGKNPSKNPFRFAPPQVPGYTIQPQLSMLIMQMQTFGDKHAQQYL
jgi:serine/threonine protein kinase